MDRLLVKGPVTLSGMVNISPAKNSCLPLMIASILSEGEITYLDLPELRDTKTTERLLADFGVTVKRNGRNLSVNSNTINKYQADYELVKTMRASIYVLGPLLARFKEAKVSLPGGCAIGARPIDMHLGGLKKLGAEIEIEAGYVIAKTKGLVGAEIVLPFPSVGATGNIMMAACLARGETILKNAAKEPELIDLAEFLTKMGAEIEGAGTSTIKIQGKESLSNSFSYRPIGDRIEAATYAIAGLITKSEVNVTGFNPEHLSALWNLLEEMGAKLEIGKDHVRVKQSGMLENKVFETAPYPGFPTDVQAQLMTLMTQSMGYGVITEKIFENRFMHVSELKRLGADINLNGNTAIIRGPSKLTGAPVMCTDLRASAALLLASLVAEGETQIQRVYHLDRGYENLEGKFNQLGAKITRDNPGEFQ